MTVNNILQSLPSNYLKDLIWDVILEEVEWFTFLDSRFWTKNGALVNPDWHELWKQEKCSSLEPLSGIFYKNQWAWQGVNLTQIVSIFTSKKVWKFLITIQLTKSDPKRTGRKKYHPSCQLGGPREVKVKRICYSLKQLWEISDNWCADTWNSLIIPDMLHF